MSWRVSLLAGVALVAAIAVARVSQDPDTGTASWDASRAAGFASYLLLWASTLLGIGLHFRVRPGGKPVAMVLEAHRITSTLALSFVAGHVAALLVGPVVRFTPIQLLVPLTSEYRPVQVGLGVVTLWLLVLVLGSTAAAGRLRYATWRKAHYLAFPCYVLALAHGITAGTDSGAMLALLLYAVTAASVAAALFARLLGRGWVAAGDAVTPLR